MENEEVEDVPTVAEIVLDLLDEKVAEIYQDLRDDVSIQDSKDNIVIALRAMADTLEGIDADEEFDEEMKSK